MSEPVTEAEKLEMLRELRGAEEYCVEAAKLLEEEAGQLQALSEQIYNTLSEEAKDEDAETGWELDGLTDEPGCRDEALSPYRDRNRFYQATIKEQ